MRIRLIDPRGELPLVSASLASRHERRRIHRVGLLSNDPSRGQGSLDFRRYLGLVGAVLQERLGPIDLVRQVKPVLTRPAEHDQLEQLADCHAVVNGLAK
ncbi:MAG: hypothetical protein KDB21_05675 [Acidimicrobiales bacterium]|nr:hypothetical protein [Acidimicrobiales bacterium]